MQPNPREPCSVLENPDDMQLCFVRESWLVNLQCLARWRPRPMPLKGFFNYVTAMDFRQPTTKMCEV